MVKIQETEYLSSAEVADRLGVTRRTAYRWMATGILQGVIDRGKDTRLRYLVPASSLDGFVPPSRTGRGRPAGSGRKEAGS